MSTQPTYRSHDGRVFDDVNEGIAHDTQLQALKGSSIGDTHVFDQRHGGYVPKCGQPGSPYIFGSRTEAYASMGLPDLDDPNHVEAEPPRSLLERIFDPIFRGMGL